MAVSNITAVPRLVYGCDSWTLIDPRKRIIERAELEF